MSYGFDPSEPVRRYHAWEREFEHRQALRREPFDPPSNADLSPWSLFTGLMTAMSGVTGASAPKTAPSHHWLRPERVRKLTHSAFRVIGIGAGPNGHTIVTPDPRRFGESRHGVAVHTVREDTCSLVR